MPTLFNRYATAPAKIDKTISFGNGTAIHSQTSLYDRSAGASNQNRYAAYIQFVPITKLITNATSASVMYIGKVRLISKSLPATYATSINESMNPNVGVKSIAAPPLNCAKTGTPASPNTI